MKLTFVITMLFSVTLAVNIYVPTDYSTISQGIAMAEDGDWVIIEPGTYHVTKLSTLMEKISPLVRSS